MASRPTITVLTLLDFALTRRASIRVTAGYGCWKVGSMRVPGTSHRDPDHDRLVFLTCNVQPLTLD